MTTILCLETTCDETAAAVIRDEKHVLSSVVASQSKLHEQYQGVVPELAARAHVERILPVIDQVMSESALDLSDLDAVAVANTPGLSGSLMVGLVAAKSLCLSLEIPLIAINHLHAHVYACQIAEEMPIFPCIGMIISGGHTHLYHYANPLEAELLGGTIDDAAGEAFDKVASMLNLPYPGGPAISAMAANGNPQAHPFPRSFIRDPALKFSFSGLKTAVRYAIAGPGNIDPTTINLSSQQVSDIAASFQQAVIDCLVAKARQALRQTGLKTLCIGGGVAANRLFRSQIATACQQDKVQLFIAPPELCTDNAVMGAIAFKRYAAGLFESLELDILPGLVR